MYVVAGATGHVGGVAARTLLDDGAQVRVILRNPENESEWTRRGALVAIASLEDAELMADALIGADGFFTLLPFDVTSGSPMDQEDRLVGALTAAVRRSGVGHVVLLSSHGAELDGGTGPVVALNRAEQALRGSGAQLTALRSGFHQENVGAALVPAREQGVFPTLLPADHPLRMVATADLGQVAAEQLLEPSGNHLTVDVQGPTYTMRDVAKKLGGRLGRRLDLVEVPPGQWQGVLRDAGMSPPSANLFAEMYDALVAGRFIPAGDRMIEATTPLDRLLDQLANRAEQPVDTKP